MKDIRSSVDSFSLIDEKLVNVEPFKKDDVFDLKTWGIHDDLRFSHYDFSMFPNDDTFLRWFKVKTSESKMLFAIKYEGFVKGYISLRNINVLSGSSTMGISLDPDYISIGLGTYALKIFLKFYFDEMKMRELNLKVSDFNKRAKRLYEKLGFKFQKKDLEEFECQLNNFPLLLMYDDFTMRKNSLCTMVSSYKITYNDFQKNILEDGKEIL